MSDNSLQEDASDTEVSDYVRENEDFLSRVLRHGDTEARGYALALLANGGTEDDIENIQQELERVKE